MWQSKSRHQGSIGGGVPPERRSHELAAAPQGLFGP